MKQYKKTISLFRIKLCLLRDNNKALIIMKQYKFKSLFKLLILSKCLLKQHK